MEFLTLPTLNLLTDIFNQLFELDEVTWHKFNDFLLYENKGFGLI